MANRRRGGNFSRGSPRLTDWALGTFPISSTAIPAATKVLAVSFGAAVLTTVGPGTIIRTRGTLWVGSDQTTATEDQAGALGIAFVNETARALGVTAIPGPATDALFDGWFVHQFIAQRVYNITNAGVDMAAGHVYNIDSKAMRKFEGDEGLVIMLENTGSTDGFVAMLGLRFLVKAG